MDLIKFLKSLLTTRDNTGVPRRLGVFCKVWNVLFHRTTRLEIESSRTLREVA